MYYKKYFEVKRLKIANRDVLNSSIFVCYEYIRTCCDFSERVLNMDGKIPVLSPLLRPN